jgi:hypothetical protein
LESVLCAFRVTGALHVLSYRGRCHPYDCGIAQESG